MPFIPDTKMISQWHHNDITLIFMINCQNSSLYVFHLNVIFKISFQVRYWIENKQIIEWKSYPITNCDQFLWNVWENANFLLLFCLDLGACYLYTVYCNDLCAFQVLESGVGFKNYWPKGQVISTKHKLISRFYWFHIIWLLIITLLQSLYQVPMFRWSLRS